MKTKNKYYTVLMNGIFSVYKKQNQVIQNLIVALGILIFILFLTTMLLNYSFFERINFFRNPLRSKSVYPKTEIPLLSLPANSTLDTKTVLDHPIPSSGCTEKLILSRGTIHNISLNFNNSQRSYLIYIPMHYSNATPSALILSYHGYASNARAQERMSQFNTLADTNSFIVVYPQGTTGVLAARGWNTGLHPTLNANDILYTSNMLNQLQSNFCIDPDRIYATGFSNGGGFVAELACRLSNRIAAFAPISGSYVTAFTSCKAIRPISIIEFHGTADRIVPYGGLARVKELATQQWLGEWAKKDGCADKPAITQVSSRITKYTWSQCKDGVEIVHYKIISGRHNWPNIQFEQTVNGKKEYADTSSIIWNFFKQHSLNK